jgi:hypothetical protein
MDTSPIVVAVASYARDLEAVSELLSAYRLNAVRPLLSFNVSIRTARDCCSKLSARERFFR